MEKLIFLHVILQCNLQGLEGIILKECEIRRYIKSAPISKIDLMDLGKLIVDNNPVDKDFTISTTIGIHSIKEKSMDIRQLV